MLAARLRELRRDVELTGRELARRCGWYPSKVSRIENARTPPSAEDVRVWCRACGAEEQTEDIIASLHAVEGMFVEWRRAERRGLRASVAAVNPRYERSRQVRTYASWVIPGMLQTRPRPPSTSPSRPPDNSPAT
ncbi:hypothetical protein GCM10027091_26120 [Streptomyces daliensis]